MEESPRLMAQSTKVEKILPYKIRFKKCKVCSEECYGLNVCVHHKFIC